MKTQRQRLEAGPAYEHGHLIAMDLLERIGEMLHDLPVPDSDEHPINWGHVGTINEVNRQLSQIIEFLGN